jgi:hypothetical protein
MNATHTKTALVTGASSGIGAELAAEFAADDYDLVLTARSEQTLEERAEHLESEYGITAQVRPADLTEPGAPNALFEDLQSRGVTVDALVNNAGLMTYGRFDEGDLERDRTMVDLNVAAVTELTKLFVRPMVERGHGEILNTASMAGMAPTPNTAVYSATKSYVISFTEAISHEFEDDGVTVTALCPGPVETPLLEKEGLEETGVHDQSLNDPASVAEAGYQGLKDGKRIVVPSMRMKALSQLKRFLPRDRVVSMAARTYEQHG